ncbi:MAG: mechanosensitive ion channel [Gemmatimonadetes bacterium]|nr:mechanosensitive ion channel [Gemmatimonadota bacterium]
MGLVIRSRVRVFEAEPKAGPLLYLRTMLYRTRNLVSPALNILLLGVAIEVCIASVGQSWLVRIVQSVAVIVFFYRIISGFAGNSLVSGLFTWIVIPLATLRVFGWLDEVSAWLDAVSLDVGTIRISLLSLGRTFVAGGVLFWLGSILNTFGKEAIRNRHALDVGTREMIIKLFQIGLYIGIFLLLLGAMGINLTALAVFGGALGVGLGFGLQKIAANFVSGLIILFDRSITPGDYIAFEDGHSGTLRELNMRSATLETFDGKDIIVPNEQFITLPFVNWTHNNKKQRYSLEFSVAYKTDLHTMLRLVREVVASHPKVLSGPELPIEERPDAEISSFGDSGVNILVEFWMLGIDDGENRVGADLLLMIWDVLKENDIEIPFPQRDVRIVRAEP